MTEQPQPPVPPRPYDDATRRAGLANAVQGEVVRGGRIESQADFTAVIIHGKPVNHVLHLILTLVTCGLWAVAWIALVIMGGEKRVMITADEWGHILRQQL